MLNKMFFTKSDKIQVNNAIITLGDTDDSGKGRHFKSRFIQPGIAGYPGQFGNVLITKESLDKFINTMVGVPVIINHKDLNNDNVDDERVGVVNSVWYDEKDGWYWCDGIIWDETAQNLITDKNWSVSCSYDVKMANDEGGSENNIPYDMEFLDGVFTHLALVDNPRYERANIVFNSKTFNISNYSPSQPRVPKGQSNGGQWVKDDALIQQKKDKLTPIEVKSEDIPQFETKEDLGNWFKSIFEDLGNVTISDTGIRIDLYGGNADREAFKRRFQQEPNKAVATAFEEVVTKSIKVDERQKDERHKHNQEIYYNKLKLGKDNYDINLFVDYLEPNKEYRYAGHNTTKIDNRISTRDTQVINHIMLTKVDNSIINDLTINFNPNVKEHEEININNNKEIEMALLDEFKKLIFKIENGKGTTNIKDKIANILRSKKVGEDIQEEVKNAFKEDDDYETDYECNYEDEEDAYSVQNAKRDYFSELNSIFNSGNKIRRSVEYVTISDREKAAEEYFAK